MYKWCSSNCKEHQEKTICLLFNAAWKEAEVLKEAREWGGSIGEATVADNDCAGVPELQAVRSQVYPGYCYTPLRMSSTIA